jgi:hypothetical protein
MIDHVSQRRGVNPMQDFSVLTDGPSIERTRPRHTFQETKGTFMRMHRMATVAALLIGAASTALAGDKIIILSSTAPGTPTTAASPYYIVQQGPSVPEPIAAPIDEGRLIPQPITTSVQHPISAPEFIAAPVDEGRFVPQPITTSRQNGQPAPEPIPAPIAPPVAPAPAGPVGPVATDPCASVDCCSMDVCPDTGHVGRRQRKERFNLCDYWEILCAMLYCGK